MTPSEKLQADAERFSSRFFEGFEDGLRDSRIVPALIDDAPIQRNAIGSYSMALRGWDGGTLSDLIALIENYRLVPHGGATTVDRRVAEIAEGSKVDRSCFTKDQLETAIKIRDITSNKRGYTVFIQRRSDGALREAPPRAELGRAVA